VSLGVLVVFFSVKRRRASGSSRSGARRWTESRRAGIVEGLEEVGRESGSGGEQDDGDFAVFGDGLEAGELPLDLGSGGVVGGGEHPVGVVDDDQADAFVGVEESGEGQVVCGLEWPDDFTGDFAAFALTLGDFGEDEDLAEVGSEGFEAGFEDIGVVALGDEQDGGADGWFGEFVLAAEFFGDEFVEEGVVGVGGRGGI
jgi:hypothetical protein